MNMRISGNGELNQLPDQLLAQALPIRKEGNSLTQTTVPNNLVPFPNRQGDVRRASLRLVHSSGGQNPIPQVSQAALRVVEPRVNYLSRTAGNQLFIAPGQHFPLYFEAVNFHVRPPKKETYVIESQNMLDMAVALQLLGRLRTENPKLAATSEVSLEDVHKLLTYLNGKAGDISPQLAPIWNRQIRQVQEWLGRAEIAALITPDRASGNTGSASGKTTMAGFTLNGSLDTPISQPEHLASVRRINSLLRPEENNGNKPLTEQDIRNLAQDVFNIKRSYSAGIEPSQRIPGGYKEGAWKPETDLVWAFANQPPQQAPARHPDGKPLTDDEKRDWNRREQARENLKKLMVQLAITTAPPPRTTNPNELTREAVGKPRPLSKPPSKDYFDTIRAETPSASGSQPESALSISKKEVEAMQQRERNEARRILRDEGLLPDNVVDFIVNKLADRHDIVARSRFIIRELEKTNYGTARTDAERDQIALQRIKDLMYVTTRLNAGWAHIVMENSRTPAELRSLTNAIVDQQKQNPALFSPDEHFLQVDRYTPYGFDRALSQYRMKAISYSEFAAKAVQSAASTIKGNSARVLEILEMAAQKHSARNEKKFISMLDRYLKQDKLYAADRLKSEEIQQALNHDNFSQIRVISRSGKFEIVERGKEPSPDDVLWLDLTIGKLTGMAEPYLISEVAEGTSGYGTYTVRLLLPGSDKPVELVKHKGDAFPPGTRVLIQRDDRSGEEGTRRPADTLYFELPQ